MYSSAVTLVDCIQSKIFLNIKVYHVWIREGRLLKMPVHKHPWCTYRTFRALLQPPSKPSTLPQKCCFGHGILCCSASGTQATEHCSNIWAQMQPSKLSLELGVPRALMRRHLSCLTLPCVWWVSKQTGWGWGADSHMREDWGFPTIRHRWRHRTSHAVLLAGKDQSFGFTVSEDVREGRLLQSLYFQELMW